MANNPLVSIAMITYNGEEFLDQQLESIYAQTYLNIEVIVCDDNSSDKTQSILEKYKVSHGLEYYINEKNLGISKNFAKAFSLCNGDFLAPSDQDDIWKKEKIETLVKEIKDSALIYSITTAIDENNEAVDFTMPKDSYINGHNNLAFLFDNCVSGHTTMFVKELLPFMKEIPEVMYPDWWSAFVASTYGKISFYEKPLVLYRRHSAQATKSTKKKRPSIISRLTAKERKKKEYIAKMISQLEAFSTLSILKTEQKEYIESLLKEFRNFESYYYNKKLEALLRQHEDELFAMHNSRVKKYTKKLSKGIWYYRSRLYI